MIRALGMLTSRMNPATTNLYKQAKKQFGSAMVPAMSMNTEGQNVMLDGTLGQKRKPPRGPSIFERFSNGL